jgi:hypothetical protein
MVLDVFSIEMILTCRLERARAIKPHDGQFVLIWHNGLCVALDGQGHAFGCGADIATVYDRDDAEPPPNLENAAGEAAQPLPYAEALNVTIRSLEDELAAARRRASLAV